MFNSIKYFFYAIKLLFNDHSSSTEDISRYINQGIREGIEFILPDKLGWNGEMASIRRRYRHQIATEVYNLLMTED